VLPPAGPPVPYASGGRIGLGCIGDPRILARRCRIGPRSSRFRFPCGAGEAVTAAARRWNKSLRLLHRLGGVLSGVGEGSVRAGSNGAGYLAVVRILPVLGDSEVGVGFLMFWRGMFQASAKHCRVMAVGVVAAWWVDLCSSLVARRRRLTQIHAQGSSGCVPGRWIFTGPFFCGSFESLAAMGLPWAWASSMASFFLDEGFPVIHGGLRRLKTTVYCTDALCIFYVFCFSRRVLCAKWCAQSSTLYTYGLYLYLYGLVYVFGMV